MALDSKSITYGTSEVTYGGVAVPNMADAATLSIAPQFIDISLYEIQNYDAVVEDYTVEVTLTFDEESYEGYKLAIAGVEENIDSVSSTVVGLQDGKTMESLRATAQELVIHPKKHGTSTDYDITVHMAIPTGTVERSYAKDKTQYQVTFRGLHKTGDPTVAGNYFRIGNPAA